MRPEVMADFRNSGGDFHRSISGKIGGGSEIVGSDVEDEQSRRLAGEFAVLQAPEYIGRAIPAKAQVEGAAVAVKLLPDGFALIGKTRMPGKEMSNGVADKNQVMRTAAYFLKFGVVAFVPFVKIVFQFGDGDNCSVVHSVLSPIV